MARRCPGGVPGGASWVGAVARSCVVEGGRRAAVAHGRGREWRPVIPALRLLRLRLPQGSSALLMLRVHHHRRRRGRAAWRRTHRGSGSSTPRSTRRAQQEEEEQRLCLSCDRVKTNHTRSATPCSSARPQPTRYRHHPLSGGGQRWWRYRCSRTPLASMQSLGAAATIFPSRSSTESPFEVEE